MKLLLGTVWNVNVKEMSQFTDWLTDGPMNNDLAKRFMDIV